MKILLLLLLIAACQAQHTDWSSAKVKKIVVEPAKNYNWKEDDRIVGGYVATPNSIPYQAGLFLTSITGSLYFCGGSLISKNFVMTAAHCAKGMRSVLVILGAQNILQNEATQIRMTSTNLTVHPAWNSKLILNDIAVIALPQPATLSKNIALATLPTLSDAALTFQGATATVSGWGKDSDAATTISSVLRYVVSLIIPNTQCNTAFPGYIQTSHICLSGAGGKSSCNGDSGGPLTTDVKTTTKLIGIVSFGSGKGCSKGYPSVYTRVTSFLSWIQANTDVKIM